MSDLGTDLSCVDDCTAEMSEVTGRICLAQAIARRYLTPRGRLIDDPNYGYDLTQYINDDLGPSDLGKIKAGSEAEALKDERVEECNVSIAVSVGGVMMLTAILTDGNGPFTLVLAITAVTVQIITVSK